MVVADDKQCFLKDVITKLIVDQLLDDEIHSSLEIQRLSCLETKFLNYLMIIIWECTFEDLINMSFLNRFIEFRIQTLLDDITRELKLTQPDEILRNLLENALVSLLIFKLQDILYKVITVGVFNQVFHMFDDVVGKL
jgi:hypothetical protein